MGNKNSIIDVDLNPDDNPFERARKAWKIMGFVTDRSSRVGTLAEVFMVYSDFDKTNSETKNGD